MKAICWDFTSVYFNLQRFQPFRAALPLLVEIWASRSPAFSGMSLYGIGLAVNGKFQKWKHWDHSTCTWIASVFIGKANLMLSGRVFVFFSESWVSLSVWPGLPVSMRRKIQVKEIRTRSFCTLQKLTCPTKGRLRLWHPPPVWTTAGLHRDCPHQRGFDCLDLGVWGSIGILLFCSPSFWNHFNSRNCRPALRKQCLVFTKIECICKAWKRILITNMLGVTGKTGLDSVISVH